MRCPFRRHRRVAFKVVVDLNPHGFTEAEWAVWMATFQALREFRPDGQGGEA